MVFRVISSLKWREIRLLGFSRGYAKKNSWNHTMAVLDTAAELNSVLLDTWRREDQANLSPVSTLKGLVFISFLILVSIYYFSTFYKFDSIVSCTQSGFSNLLIWLAFCNSSNDYVFVVFVIFSILWFSVKPVSVSLYHSVVSVVRKNFIGQIEFILSRTTSCICRFCCIEHLYGRFPWSCICPMNFFRTTDTIETTDTRLSTGRVVN